MKKIIKYTIYAIAGIVAMLMGVIGFQEKQDAKSELKTGEFVDFFSREVEAGHQQIYSGWSFGSWQTGDDDDGDDDDDGGGDDSGR